MSSEELYENYKRNNPADEREIPVFNISHSKLTKDYWICQEEGGLTLGLDGGTVFAEGINFSFTKQTTTDDLDERFTLNFDDPEGIIQSEVDRIPIDDDERVQVNYYVWMASDTSEPAIGPILLFGNSFTPTAGAGRIDASSPSLVDTRTGELYSYERFPPLLGFL